jgi:hypothetical protein
MTLTEAKNSMRSRRSILKDFLTSAVPTTRTPVDDPLAADGS